MRRSRQRQVLWNGNEEPPLWTVFTDPEHVVRWAWSTHHESAQRVAAVLDLNPDLTVIRPAARHYTVQLGIARRRRRPGR